MRPAPSLHEFVGDCAVGVRLAGDGADELAGEDEVLDGVDDGEGVDDFAAALADDAYVQSATAYEAA